MYFCEGERATRREGAREGPLPAGIMEREESNREVRATKGPLILILFLSLPPKRIVGVWPFHAPDTCDAMAAAWPANNPFSKKRVRDVPGRHLLLLLVDLSHLKCSRPPPLSPL